MSEQREIASCILVAFRINQVKNAEQAGWTRRLIAARDPRRWANNLSY